jgi:hypothetical protein
MYYEWNGNIFNFLNKSLQEYLFLFPVIILIALFCILSVCMSVAWKGLILKMHKVMCFVKNGRDMGIMQVTCINGTFKVSHITCHISCS